ncbi:hypothetical protein KQX54_007103 [Cotesia glomerata]|uniref:LIM zinc-binding domain-containing protein n=1 Tax=Cotesia glomerata TaxID=32391 RepID=A0AAV7J5Z3_COTGL|nr:hypothetical protein KQX54_007103 [Cotesia glomerata]
MGPFPLSTFVRSFLGSLSSFCTYSSSVSPSTSSIPRKERNGVPEPRDPERHSGPKAIRQTPSITSAYTCLSYCSREKEVCFKSVMEGKKERSGLGIILEERTGYIQEPGVTPIHQCAGCGGMINERFLLHAMERYWHNNCLKCNCCHRPLADMGTSCYYKNNMILCKPDYMK